MSDESTTKQAEDKEDPYKDSPDDWFLEAPDGMCPSCYRHGDYNQLVYNDGFEMDVCPYCGYYE